MRAPAPQPRFERCPVGARRPAARAGLTLIELVVVMGLIGVLLGAGIGMLSTLNLGERAAIGLVQNVIRAARNTALARSSPAIVRIDRAAGTISAEGTQVVGTWHFEDERMRGGRQLDGRIGGAEVVSGGYIGKALSFTKAQRGSVATVPIDGDPAVDPTDGFTVECAIRLEGTHGGKVLDLGGVVGLEVSGLGAVRGWMRPRVLDDAGRPARGGPVALDSPPGVLTAGAWSRVRFEYDRTSLRLSVNGVEVARDARETQVWTVEGPLVLGDERQGFPGSVDALVVSVVAASEVATLPEGTAFGADAPALIVFAPDGHLDREVHAGPIEFHVEFEDGRRNLVRVGLYGTVE